MWRDIFGDSREYIDMIIDGYFNEDVSELLIEDSHLISSSLVIPYRFRRDLNAILDSPQNIESADSIKTAFNSALSPEYTGYYLCGLMTKRERRGGGIMRRMLTTIESTAKQNNVDFTFLIPADEKLRRYYSGLGYENTARRTIIKLKSTLLNTSNEYGEEKRNPDLDLPKCNPASKGCAIQGKKSEIYRSPLHNYNYQSEIIEISPADAFKFSNCAHITFEKNDDLSAELLSEISKSIVNSSTVNVFLFIKKNINNISSFSDLGKEIDNYHINAKSYLTKSSHVSILHSQVQWRDVLLDYLRENSSIIIAQDTVLLVTQDRKFFPISGTANNVWELIKLLIPGVTEPSTSPILYSIYIGDPVNSRILLNLIEEESTKVCNGLNDQIPKEGKIQSGEEVRFGGLQFEVEKIEEDYGMAKSFNPKISPSSIVINFMFD